MKKKFKSILIIVNLIIFLILSLINSKLVIDSILDYSKLFLTKLFPVSFILFIISSLLIDYGLIQILNKYLKINTSSIYIFIISMISGFPSGAKYIKELLDKNLITDEEANRYLMFSHFPNPLFILGSVNTILNDSSLSLKILLSIIISNFIIFIFYKGKHKKNHYYSINIPNDFSKELSTIILNSFKILSIVYGTSLFFYLIASIITNYLNFNIYTYIFTNGLFDLCKGVFSTTLIANNIIRSYFILLFISFGSISIHMQVKSIIANSPLKYKYYLKGRIIGTILSFIIIIYFKTPSATIPRIF